MLINTTPFYIAGGGAGPATTFLLHSNNGNNSQSFIDSSTYGHTITPTATLPRHRTDDKKFQASSIEGSQAKYLNVNTNAAFDFGGDEFTIDYWHKKVGSAVDGNHLHMDGATPSANGFFVQTRVIWFTGLNWVRFGIGKEGGTVEQTAEVYLAYNNTWNHLACVATASSLNIYHNGVLASTAARTLSVDPGQILKLCNDATAWRFDEVRISNTARWTTNFTPPTAPYTGAE